MEPFLLDFDTLILGPTLMTLLLIYDLFLILSMLETTSQVSGAKSSNESNAITEEVADQVAQGDSQGVPGVPRFLLVLQQIQPLCIALCNRKFSSHCHDCAQHYNP